METLIGGNLVDVELTAADYDTAFTRAKTKFQQHGNHGFEPEFYSLPVLTGENVYTLTSEVVEIIKVIRPSSGFYTDNPFHIAMIQDLISPLYRSNSGCGDASGVGDLLIYDLTLAYLEEIDRRRVTDVIFHYNPFNKKLILEQQPVGDETWLLHAYSTMTDEIYREMFWIQDWALSELKIILGMAYRKFSSLNTPAGDNSLPGTELIQEGRDDQARLIEDIKNFVDGESSTAGGVIIR
jgi:hypothetical protein